MSYVWGLVVIFITGIRKHQMVACNLWNIRCLFFVNIFLQRFNFNQIIYCLMIWTIALCLQNFFQIWWSVLVMESPTFEFHVIQIVLERKDWKISHHEIFYIRWTRHRIRILNKPQVSFEWFLWSPWHAAILLLNM